MSCCGMLSLLSGPYVTSDGMSLWFFVQTVDTVSSAPPSGAVICHVWAARVQDTRLLLLGRASHAFIEFDCKRHSLP